MPSLLPIQQENRGRRREGFEPCLQHPGSTAGLLCPRAAGVQSPQDGVHEFPALLWGSEPFPGPDLPRSFFKGQVLVAWALQ